MSQSRYQIFVSSTFKDLKDERSAVLNAILKLNQFPAGMENFPAANDTAWELIKKIIEVSDYYVLIIGGKYGSMDENGISYTEKEYDFARAQGIHILAFTHAQPGKIEVDKTEQKPAIRKKLEAFKKKVGNNHHWNYWKNADDLREKVITSLSQAIVMYPQKGWVKAGGIEKNELLERLADLQKRYDELVIENQKIKDSSLFFDTEQFSFGNDQINIEFNFSGAFVTKEISLTWNELFFSIGEFLLSKIEEKKVKIKIRNFVYENARNEGLLKELEISGIDTRYEKFSVSNESITTIKNQLLALELIELSDVPLTFSTNNYKTETSFECAWKLTEKGTKLFLSQNAILRNNQEHSQ